MRRVPLSVRAVLFALAVAVILSCNGVPPIPQDCRLIGCPTGLVCTESPTGAWSCQEPPPCSETNPCADDQICVDGKCEPKPAWECPLPYPGCYETGQICSNPPDERCWVNPTQNPEHCEEAVLCAEPPPPVQCVDIEHRLVGAGDPAPQFREKVKIATNALGDLTGQDWKKNLQKLAVKLMEQNPGMCAFAGIEAVFIKRPDGLWEEVHAVHSGTGSWTNSGFGKYKGSHRDTNPPEPPSGECVDPDPTGLEAEFVLHCGQGNGTVCDSTYRVKGREYCDQVCSPLEPDVCFTGRLWCPMRFEGDPERHACYAEIIAPQQWWCDGQPIDSLENPARARCTGLAKTCTADGATCGQKDAS